MKKLLLPTLLILSVVFMHCKEPELQPNSNYKLYPLSLKVEKLANGNVKYSWNAIVSSGFKSYTILRNSNDSVPYFINNESMAARDKSISLIININDPTVTEFVDTNSVLTNLTFVRLFASVDDRMLSSTNVSVSGNPNINELKFRSDNVNFSKKYNQLLFGDNSRNVLTLYDLRFKKTISSFNNLNIPSGADINYVETNGGDFFLTSNNVGNSFLIDCNTPSKTSFIFLQSNFSIISHFNLDFIAGASFNQISSFNVSKISNGTFINPTTTVSMPFDTSVLGSSFLKRYNSGFKFMLVRNGKTTLKMTIFNFVEDGSIRPNPVGEISHRLIPNSTFKNGRPFGFTKDDNFVIVDNNATAYPINGTNKLKKLAEEVPNGGSISYTDIVVNPTTGTIYAMRASNNGRANRKIDVFAYPDFQFQKSIDYSTQANRMFLNGNGLLLVSFSNSDNFNTVLENIDF